MRHITAQWYRDHVAAHNARLAAPYSDRFRACLTRPQLFRVFADGRVEPREPAERKPYLMGVRR